MAKGAALNLADLVIFVNEFQRKTIVLMVTRRDYPLCFSFLVHINLPVILIQLEELVISNL